MNDEKLRRLFSSARGEPAPVPDASFAERVRRAVRNEAKPGPVSLFEQLGELFPRLALASLALIGLCVVADLGYFSLDGGDLAAGAVDAADQWVFSVRGF